MSDDIRFTTGVFHLIQRPQFLWMRFEPGLDFSPIEMLVAVHVPLEAGLQRSEQGFALLCR
jgi:hypothetical protein